MNEDEIREDQKLTEDDVNEIIDLLCQDGLYKRAEIVKVYCPACGEEFIGTKRHAGGFIAGHQTFHEFENNRDVLMVQMGGQ